MKRRIRYAVYIFGNIFCQQILFVNNTEIEVFIAVLHIISTYVC